MTIINDRYYVTFTADTGISVTVLLDAASPFLTDGFTGWEVIERPKRVAMTRFKGKTPFKQDIAIIFDGLTSGKSQEIDINQLIYMTKMPGVGMQPPTVSVSGTAIRKDIVWIIEDITWDSTNVMWDIIGGFPCRVRQNAVVHLCEFVDDDIITTASSPAASKPKNDPGSVTTLPGETLKQIAQDVYGDPSKWMTIFYANPWLTADPTAIIPAGTVLAIPGKNSFVVS